MILERRGREKNGRWKWQLHERGSSRRITWLVDSVTSCCLCRPILKTILLRERHKNLITINRLCKWRKKKENLLTQCDYVFRYMWKKSFETLSSVMHLSFLFFPFFPLFFSLFFCKSRLKLEAMRCDNVLMRYADVTKFLHVAIRNVAYYYAYNFCPCSLLVCL